MKKILKKLYSHFTTIMMMVGIAPAIAIFNVRDPETWKRGFWSPVIGICACILSFPLLPFLGLGIVCAMIEDRYLHEPEDWNQV